MAVVFIYLALFLASLIPTEANVSADFLRQLSSSICKDLRGCTDFQHMCNESIVEKYCPRTCGICWEVDEFTATYHKTYRNEAEAKQRMNILKENFIAMKEHNKLYESGASSFMMGINEYFDLTYDEVISTLTGAKEPTTAERYEIPPDDLYVPTDIGSEPEYTDYREKGALNPVRNQGGCGSCWAFSAVSSIESNIFIKSGEVVELSEQSLVDCDNRGNCVDGGWPDFSILHVKENGIAHRDDYEYTGKDDTCRDVKNIYPVEGMKRIRKYNESELLNALVYMGPITITLQVTPNFHKYKSGVLVDDQCPPNTLNHAVLLVGHGTEDGQDYWLIRNSWGESWGEKGYIKMARNVKNDCGISKNGYLPVIKDSSICKDILSDCADIQESCHDPFVKLNCQKTCGTCEEGHDTRPPKPSRTCENRIANCPQKGICNYREAALELCPKSCGLCQEECLDQGYCWDSYHVIKKMCKDHEYTDVVLSDCPKTCGVCK